MISAALMNDTKGSQSANSVLSQNSGKAASAAPLQPAISLENHAHYTNFDDQKSLSESSEPTFGHAITSTAHRHQHQHQHQHPCVHPLQGTLPMIRTTSVNDVPELAISPLKDEMQWVNTGPKGWKVVFIGTGQDAGIPQIMCHCHNCMVAKYDRRLRRTASSVAIVCDEISFLLDASPDISQQFNTLGFTDLQGIFLTHAHAGHITGLLRLGKEGPNRPVPVYLTPLLKAVLSTNKPYSQLFDILRAKELDPNGGSVTITVPSPGGNSDSSSLSLTFTFYPINHRHEMSDTVAILVSDGKVQFLYIPDTDAIDDAVLTLCQKLHKGDMVVLDGTFYSAGELRCRDMKHIPHPLVGETIKHPVLKSLINDQKVRIVFSHINHSNPIAWVGSREYQAVVDAGYEVSRDGMEWEFLPESHCSNMENVFGGGI